VSAAKRQDDVTAQAERSTGGAFASCDWTTATPFFTAVISASTETAISGGVLLPSHNPTGPCSRAISSADRSNSSSRFRRLSLFSR